jgi:L-amino acid N-acyltransferase YncA
MKINIRPYEPKDAAVILEIINFNILHTTSIYDYNIRSLEKQIAILEDKLQKNFPVIVADLNGDCVGFGSYSEFRFREANKYTVEHSIYVLHQCHGLGIGNLLMHELIRIAKSQNLHTMIGVIDSQNENSIKFHEKHNFKSVGIVKEVAFKFDQWLDCNIMQLILK